MSLWRRQGSGLTFVIGASIVIECILAMEEYRRVCKLGAAIRENNVHLAHSESDDSISRVQKAVTREQHIRMQPHLPFLLYLCSSKFLLCCLISCTSHFHCQFFCPSVTYTEMNAYLGYLTLHIQHLPLSHCSQWTSVRQGSCCETMCVHVPHLSDTAALMKITPLYTSCASLTTYHGRKKFLAPPS